MSEQKNIQLILEDGTTFTGQSFGGDKSSSGEMVFNTSMTGYPENLSDPAMAGQILVFTFPVVGNYGVPPTTKEEGLHTFYESDTIHAAGIVVSEYTEKYSHWNAEQSLGSFLKKHNIPAISGIDTRELAQHLRDNGPMLGKIVVDNNDLDFYQPDSGNLSTKVSIKEKNTYGTGDKKILLIDMGTKESLIKNLLRFNTTVIRVPWDYDFSKEEYDGIIISNGPGNPIHYSKTVTNIQNAIQNNHPIYGIGLGHLLLGIAAGGTTEKMKQAHRSNTHPVLKVGSENSYITNQNHGFVLNTETLSNDWASYFISLNDDSNEGIKHKTKPFYSTQFHPEMSNEPSDTDFLLNEFIQLVSKKQ